MYTGVEFRATGEIEGIPDSWMLPCQSKVRWPKLKVKSVRVMIKNYDDAPALSETWDVRILFRATSYEEMLKLLREAQYTSDVGKTYTKEGRSARKRVKMVSSSDSDESPVKEQPVRDQPMTGRKTGQNVLAPQRSSVYLQVSPTKENTVSSGDIMKEVLATKKK